MRDTSSSSYQNGLIAGRRRAVGGNQKAISERRLHNFSIQASAKTIAEWLVRIASDRSVVPDQVTPLKRSSVSRFCGRYYRIEIDTDIR
jgi:hypothetical protein